MNNRSTGFEEYLSALVNPDEAQRRCRACRLSETRTQVAMPRGPANAKLFLLYETPTDPVVPPRGVGRSVTPISVREILAAHGILEDEYARGDCCACDSPDNRRPTAAEVAACSRWLYLSLTKRFSPSVIFAIGALVSCLFYNTNTLSLAIERAAALRYCPDLDWARDANLRVVPVPQLEALASQRRSRDAKPWNEIGIEQVAIGVSLLKKMA